MSGNFCNAKTGSLVFGYFSSISTGLLILITYALLVPINISYMESYWKDTLNIIGHTLTVLSILNLMFSTFLIVGITKKFPGYVMAYFVYGVLLIVLTLVAIMVFAILIVDNVNDDAPVIGILSTFVVGCLIYSLFLVMVFKAYKQMVSSQDVTFQYNKVNEI